MVRVIRRGFQKPRVAQRPHLPAELPGQRAAGAMHNLVRQHNRRRQIVAWFEAVIGHRRDGRPIGRLGLPAIIARRQRCAAGEHHVMPVAVLNVRMRERPAQRPFLTPLGQLRQVLANLNARRLGRNGIELATHLLRRVGLQVKTLVLRQSAREENINDILRPALPRLRRLQCRQVVHAQPQYTEGACLNGGAAGKRNLRWMMRGVHRFNAPTLRRFGQFVNPYSPPWAHWMAR